jgi:hypothetical protein
VVWWQTLLVALASSVVGGVLAQLGGSLLYRQQQRTRDRERAAETLGAVLTALREISPDTYAERLRIDPRAGELIMDKRDRWLDAAGRLEVLVALRREAEVATLGESVIKKGNLLLIRLDEMVGAANPPSQAWLEAIPPRYEEAVHDVRELVRIILGVDRPARMLSRAPGKLDS